MSRSTPVCQLKCSKCHAKGTADQRYGDAPTTWYNVRVIARVGDRGVQCECRTCGHAYVSQSRAANRKLGRLHDPGPAYGLQRKRMKV